MFNRLAAVLSIAASATVAHAETRAEPHAEERVAVRAERVPLEERAWDRIDGLEVDAVRAERPEHAERADELAVSYLAETSVASAYVSRGMQQYADLGVPSAQNTLTVRVDHVGPGALSIGTWNAVALSDYNAQGGTALELDLLATYAFSAGPVAMSTSYIAYMFPEHEEGTPLDGAHEVAVTAAYENRYVTPTVATWVELARQQGAYVTLTGSHDFHIGPCTISPALTVGGAAYRKYLGGEQAASPHLNDVTANLGLRLEVDAGVYVALRGSYAYRGTPIELMPEVGDDFGDRSTLVGVLALGVAR